jgi:NAD(P)-dependent dehydrogenase (short-subunit alcohol dehydrogenase family)
MNQLGKGLLALAAVGAGAWLLSRGRRRPAEYDFRGKAVLITGGSRGLGLVLARQLAAQGARLAICARDEEELERAGADLARHGGWPLALPCDIADAADARRLVDRVTDHFGRIDVLVNNAGIIQVGPLEEMTRADFQNALNINFWGAYNFVEAALPQMRQRREGRIVNISSIGGKVSVPHLLPYNVSKFALTGFSEGLRAEVARDGVVVTTVIPGLMRTGSPPHALFKGKNRAEYAWFSISDSLPFITLSAEKAAEQILDACRRGEAEAILTWPAQLAVRLNALFPDMVADILTVVNRLLLPGPGGIGTAQVEGKDSQSPASPSVLTALGDKAAQRNNEVAPSERGAKQPR